MQLLTATNVGQEFYELKQNKKKSPGEITLNLILGETIY